LNIVILAAGQGTRLRPYTNNIPKCMVKVDGQSLIERQIEVIKYCGLKNIYIVTGYLANKLKDDSLIHIYNSFYKSTNMVYSLFCAEELFNDEIIISYGDIVYSRAILDGLLSKKEDISVVIDKGWKSYWSKRFKNYINDIETLELSKEGNIIDIGKAVIDENKVQGQYIGLLKLTKKGATIFKETYKKCKRKKLVGNKPIEESYLTDFIQEIIYRGFPVSAFLTDDPWVEIDTVSDLKLNLNKIRLAKIKKDLNS
tara:strand:+ start:185 stop:952 length:768 start_codon:yes stop_codon:yes gene_type:complete